MLRSRCAGLLHIIGPKEIRVKISLIMPRVNEGVRTIKLARKSSAALPSGLTGMVGCTRGAKTTGDDGRDAISTESTSMAARTETASSSSNGTAGMGDEPTLAPTDGISFELSRCDCRASFTRWQCATWMRLPLPTANSESNAPQCGQHASMLVEFSRANWPFRCDHNGFPCDHNAGPRIQLHCPSLRMMRNTGTPSKHSHTMHSKMNKHDAVCSASCQRSLSWRRRNRVVQVRLRRCRRGLRGCAFRLVIVAGWCRL